MESWKQSIVPNNLYAFHKSYIFYITTRIYDVSNVSEQSLFGGSRDTVINFAILKEIMLICYLQRPQEWRAFSK